MKKSHKLTLLYVIALAFLLAGAVGSLTMTLQAGHSNKSYLLVGLFASWVLSPFIALVVANVVSRHWSEHIRLTIYFLMIFLSFASLICYSVKFNITAMKTAFIFLIVPLISWLLIIIIIPIVISLSRKKQRKNNSL